MSKRSISIFLTFGLVGGLCFCPTLAEAKDDNVAYVDEFVRVPFAPKQVLLLQETKLGKLQRYEGTAALADPDANDTDSRVLAGAKIWWDSRVWGGTSKPMAFFFIDRVGRFAATAVQQWNTARVMENSKSIDELQKDIVRLKIEIENRQRQIESTGKKLTTLRETAASIADVDKIIDLKIELAQLTGLGDKAESEMQRLRSLVDGGYAKKEAPGLVALSKDLSLLLREGAKATAMVDRLNRRKQQSGLRRLKRKLSMIESTRSIDTEKLAKEVLRARRKRTEYERRMGLKTRDYDQDF